MATPPLAPIVAGRWGTPGPHDWDDGSHTGVKQIFLEFDDAGIRFFRADYIDIDQPFEGPAHGTKDVAEWVEIPIDFPGEYITNVSGYIKPGDTTVVRSLTFTTNRGRYGSYGGHTPNQDIHFEIPIDSRFRVSGFKGASSDELLNAIGVNKSK